jgi:hypothetical protein
VALIEILNPLVQFITSITAALGYGRTFLLMIFESALIPIPSEIIMPFSGSRSDTMRHGRKFEERVKEVLNDGTQFEFKHIIMTAN